MTLLHSAFIAPALENKSMPNQMAAPRDPAGESALVTDPDRRRQQGQYDLYYAEAPDKTLAADTTRNVYEIYTSDTENDASDHDKDRTVEANSKRTRYSSPAPSSPSSESRGRQGKKGKDMAPSARYRRRSVSPDEWSDVGRGRDADRRAMSYDHYHGHRRPMSPSLRPVSRRAYSDDNRHERSYAYGHKHGHDRYSGTKDDARRKEPRHDIRRRDNSGDGLGLSSLFRRFGLYDDGNGDDGKRYTQSHVGDPRREHLKRHDSYGGTKHSDWLPADDSAEEYTQRRTQDSSGARSRRTTHSPSPDSQQWHRQRRHPRDKSPRPSRSPPPFTEKPFRSSRSPSRPRRDSLSADDGAVIRHEGLYDLDRDYGYGRNSDRKWNRGTDARADRRHLPSQPTQAKSVSGHYRRAPAPDRQRQGTEESRKRSKGPSSSPGSNSSLSSALETAARNALRAGTMAALSSQGGAGSWLGNKGSRVATAALGAALVDTYMGHKHPRSVNGVRHTAMRQVAEYAISNMVAEPILQRAARRRTQR